MDIFRFIKGNFFSSCRSRLVVLVIATCLTSSARAGSITTLDGHSYDGEIKIEDGALTINQKIGSKVKVDVANLLKATIANSPDDRPLLRGVVLTTGQAFAADAVSKLDDNGVRIVRPGGIALSVTNDVLARVIFRPVSAEILKRVPPGHGGVILDNGDFFEGDLSGGDDNHVTINSVLFGVRTFDTTREALAVVLHDATSPSGDCILRLMNGSVFMGKAVSIVNSKLTIVDDRVGTVSVPTRDVLDLKIGGGALEALTAPDKTDAGANDAYTVDGTTAGVPMTLLGMAPAHGIGMKPGVSLSWNLAGKYKSFMAHAGVPVALVPLRRLQFVVLADGKEVFRSSPRSSVDDPSIVGVNLAGVQTMTLRIEGTEANSPGAAGVWGDPILVKAK